MVSTPWAYMPGSVEEKAARWRKVIADMERWGESQTDPERIAANNAAIWAAEHMSRIRYRRAHEFNLRMDHVDTALSIRLVYTGEVLDVRCADMNQSELDWMRDRELEHLRYDNRVSVYAPSRTNGGMVPFYFDKTITHTCVTRDFAGLMAELHDAIKGLEDHERLEFFRYDGRPVYNPHPRKLRKPGGLVLPEFRTARPDHPDVGPFDAE